MAIESLARQVGAPPWDLVIVEEQDDDAHGPPDADMMARLCAAGCVSLFYVPSSTWIPLPEKWRIIADAAHPRSSALVLQSADCYSQPHRLAETHALHAAGATWTHAPRGPFYDVHTGAIAEYRGADGRTHLNMSVDLDLATELPPSSLRSSVDGWLFGEAKRIARDGWVVAENPSDHYRQGCDLHGLNTISHHRGAMIAEARPPFYAVDYTIDDVLPADIVDRLRSQ
ncbi:MAG: hypothetical protein O2895_07060 [Chloroflexi bacterium]|nr:hypothetical protein [Chloroflexota bacterium]